MVGILFNYFNERVQENNNCFAKVNNCLCGKALDFIGPKHIHPVTLLLCEGRLLKVNNHSEQNHVGEDSNKSQSYRPHLVKPRITQHNSRRSGSSNRVSMGILSLIGMRANIGKRGDRALDVVSRSNNLLNTLFTRFRQRPRCAACIRCEKNSPLPFTLCVVFIRSLHRPFFQSSRASFTKNTYCTHA